MKGLKLQKKRTKNILIFNSDQYASIHLKVSCNITVLNNAIVADDAEYTKKGKSIIFKFIREEISFHKIQIEDKSNNITYIFKIAIMDMPAQFILPTVKHSFSIVYKPKKSNCRIKLVGVGTDLVFNKGAEDIRKCKLGDNEIYSCKCGERLYIYSSENELVNLGSGIKIDINFSGVIVPFVLYPDEPKSQEIIGRRILKEKLAAKKSFVFENDAIQTDAQEYFAKTNLLRELRIEKEIVSQKAIYGQIRNFYTSDKVVLEKKELKVPEKLAKAYTELLSAFEEEKTIPTLAYLGGGLKSFVSAYIEAFKDCYASLQDGEILSPEQESALQIGTIEVGRNAEEILFTPFHPLNLAYQLSLLEETGIENATDVIIERLNSVNLLPYIQKNRRIYKVSDELYSQEWKYYAPVENKKYRGGRRYVPRLVEEKISEFALKIIERYEIELQKRKIDVLAETITNCYTKLANKKNLIKTIVMDPETLDLKYLSEEGIEIPKDSLSAGEQQLMVISILWALAICSKKKLPVIIDTPLSRLDSLHRTALITTYFPNAGEQTIILSTDSEIDENYYELMRENVGDEFTLKYDEDSKSTSIERGYLIGAKL